MEGGAGAASRTSTNGANAVLLFEQTVIPLARDAVLAEHLSLALESQDFGVLVSLCQGASGDFSGALRVRLPPCPSTLGAIGAPTQLAAFGTPLGRLSGLTWGRKRHATVLADDRRSLLYPPSPSLALTAECGRPPAHLVNKWPATLDASGPVERDHWNRHRRVRVRPIDGRPAASQTHAARFTIRHARRRGSLRVPVCRNEVAEVRQVQPGLRRLSPRC